MPWRLTTRVIALYVKRSFAPLSIGLGMRVYTSSLSLIARFRLGRPQISE
jgi:hypothetical protein